LTMTYPNHMLVGSQMETKQMNPSDSFFQIGV